MNLTTEKIVRKWAHKNYFSSDPHKYRLLAIACSLVRDFTLIEAVNFIKKCRDEPRKCYVCGEETAYVHGRIIDSDVKWHCIGTC